MYDDTWLRELLLSVSEDVREQRRDLKDHIEQDAKAHRDMSIGVAHLQVSVDAMAKRKQHTQRMAQWAIMVMATIMSGSPFLVDYFVGWFKR